MPSAGVHVMLPDYYSPQHMGLIVPKTKDGRVVFMLPWQGATVAGTTGAPRNWCVVSSIDTGCPRKLHRAFPSCGLQAQQ